MAAQNAEQPHLPVHQEDVVPPQQLQSPMPIQVPLPDRFNFGTPDSWPAWVRRFDRFRIASGLANRPANDQISTMVYAMGDQAEDILRTLNIPNDASYDYLKQSLDRYFGVRRNLIIERAKFNRRVQQQGESVDVFIQDLYRLVEHCEYGELREQLLRDRIVVGVIDDALSDRLQAQADMTLDQSVQISRQAEARKQQRGVNTTVEFVKRDQRSSTKPNTARHSGKCKWCGSQQQHDRNRCPARQATCHHCNKVGHFRSVCRSTASGPEIKPPRSKQNAAHCVGDVFLGEIKRTRRKMLDGGSDDRWQE